jgi:mannose-6-phosphate isomerase-like protein (cupin superfamily)
MKRALLSGLLCCAGTFAQTPARPAAAPQPVIKEDGLDPSPIGAPTDLDNDKFINDYHNSPVRTLFGKLAVQDILTKLEGPDPQHPTRKGAVLSQGIIAISHGTLAAGATASGRAPAGERISFYTADGAGSVSANGRNYEVRQGIAFAVSPAFDFKLTATKALEFYIRTDALAPGNGAAGKAPAPDLVVGDRYEKNRSIGAHWAHIPTTGIDGMLYVSIAPRTMPQPHSHTQEEVWLAIKGETILSAGKTTMPMKAGMAFKAPPNGMAAHSNINLGDEPAEFIFLGPAGGPPAGDYGRLDNSPFKYGEEQDVDMFMGSWRNGFPRIEHGNMYFRDMLTALKGGDPLHPARRGAVLTNADAVSFVQLEPKSSAHPLEGELQGVQETFVVNSGAGFIVSNGKKTELQKDMAFILTPGLDFKITATGDHYLTFYAVTEKLPAGFVPKKELTVVDNRNKPQTTTLWVDKERPLITKADGLAQYRALTQVEQGTMSMSRPYSADKGVEEIWIATEGDTDMLLGKELRKLPAGSAYRVPSTGITAHTEINTSGKPAKFLYLVK